MAAKSSYDWSKFTLKIFIKAPQSRVFDAWLNDKSITKWFTSSARHDARKGGNIAWGWQAGDTFEGKFVSIKKNQSIVFTFGNHGEKVRVRTLKSGHGTVCEIHQYDMRTSPKDRWMMHRGCLQGWTFFLANLKSVLENRKDLRSKDPKQNYRKDFING